MYWTDILSGSPANNSTSVANKTERLQRNFLWGGLGAVAVIEEHTLEKKKNIHVGKLESMLFNNVNLPTFDKYNLYQLAKQCSISSKIGSQIAIDLKQPPMACQGKSLAKTLPYNTKRSAKSVTFSTSPTGTISPFPKLTLKLDTASKQVNNIQMYKICSVLAS